MSKRLRSSKLLSRASALLVVVKLHSVAYSYVSDGRRTISEIYPEFADFDFSEVLHDEDVYYKKERESDEHCCARAQGFLEWLNRRPEKCIAVVTHSSFLRHLFCQFGENLGLLNNNNNNNMPSSTLLTPPCAYLPSPNSSSFYIATYANDESTNKKSGHIFKLNKNYKEELSVELDAGALSLSLHVQESEESESESSSVILVASSNGSLLYLSLSLSLLFSLPICTTALTDVRSSPSSPSSTIITSSLLGHITLIKNRTPTHTFPACTYPTPSPTPAECWSLSFHPSGILSGGEDCKLTLWSLGDFSKITHNSNFDAGVTLIKYVNSVIHVGSYDDVYRQITYDSEKLIVLRSIKMPGGIWRIEINSGQEIAAACMYGGCVVLGEKEGELEIKRKEETESICYYVGWREEGGVRKLGWGSFYDRKLCWDE
ncbi:hypothetical protein TrVE_jg7353 [Triparma verrucosa]|uniref:methylated diphthine methylhydrolase n=1 Tax=Triparma verrucosa TaxID=1606542 RepID=A0A9W7ESK2_9STRA|nr:hypothetical protein TrVE_jg7353 [Triparma verrucosa]